MIIYTDNAEKFAGKFDFSKANSVKFYTTHYENLKMLEFFAKNTKNAIEKITCEKQMMIAKRKMKFWEKTPNFVLRDAIEQKKTVDRKWQ